MRLGSEILATGPRVLLRNVCPSDVTEDYCKWMNDHEVTRFIESRFNPNTQQDILDYVTKMADSPDNLFMAIVVRDTSQHIGNIKIASINRHHDCADVSIIIGAKSSWGKGFAAEAIALAAEIAFRDLGLHKLTAGCYAPNLGSLGAFLKAGFLKEAILAKHYLCDEGWVDRICMARFNDAYTNKMDPR